jgi:predicted XRE-type DNA-binding protein
LQDLSGQTKKLRTAIWQLAATQPDCSKEVFEDAWKKREQLNQLNGQLASIGEQLERCLPRASTARLTEKERTEIKGLYNSGLYTQSQLAEQYDVTQPTISDITKK